MFAQQAQTPSFEVASIKPAAPVQNNGPMRIGMRSDAGRVDLYNATLKQILARAYDVKAYQISGPGWIDSERYEVVAKVPDGVGKEQIPAMLQNLLAERFKMKVHRETKDQSVYALVVSKNGPKLTPSSDDPTKALPPILGPDGAPLPKPPGGGGGAMMMVNANGHIEARKTSMAGLVNLLSTLLDRPVFDMTEIKGEYDVSLDLAPEDMAGMRRAMPAGGPPPGAVHEPPAATDSTPGGSVFTAIQALGLKLESRKTPVEMIVVDQADKVPTEN